MCLAIYIPTGAQIDKNRLWEAHKANPDGWGFMWATDGQLYRDRGVRSFEEFWTWFNGARSGPWIRRDFVAHFRTASASDVGLEYCHPFWVNDELAFVHNGNLPEFGLFRQNGIDKRSDTQRFNDEVLKKMPADFLEQPLMRRALTRYCVESMSKMIFLDSAGKVTIINEEAGYWEDRMWFSNGGIKNYTGYGFSGAYSYQKGDVRHKGGLLTVQMFSEERRKKWAWCDKCLGWYPKEKVAVDTCSGCGTLAELMEFTQRREI